MEQENDDSVWIRINSTFVAIPRHVFDHPDYYRIFDLLDDKKNELFDFRHVFVLGLIFQLVEYDDGLHIDDMTHVLRGK